MTRILVVDDHADNRYYLEALLGGHRFVVQSATNGEEALALAREAPPDLVVSDLLMPVMDGYTLLRHWKADPTLRPVPFIVYTATYTQPEDRDLAMDLGADAFIVKPAEPDVFMAQVNGLLQAVTVRPAAEPRSPIQDEGALLTRYNEALIRKLEQKTARLVETNHRLEAELEERRRRETERVGLLHDLGERVKELRALYEVGHVLRDDRLPVPRLLERVVAQLPVAMQFPDVTMARASYGSETAATARFSESPWMLTSRFVTSDGTAGRIDVAYAAERPRAAEGPFLAEERQLLDSLAEMIGVHLDRRLAQDALRSSEERLRTILNSEPECVKVVSGDGRLLDMNPAGLAMVEAADVAAVRDRPVIDLIHPADRASFAALHRQAARGEPGQLRFRLIGLRGGERWVESHAAPLRERDGSISAVLSVTRDVTDRRRAEQALAEAQRQQVLVLESVEEGIHGLNAAGHVVFANPAGARMLGWSEAELVGRLMHELAHHHRADGTPYPIEACPVHLTLQDGLVRRVADEVFFRRDGSSFAVEYTCSPMRDEQGAVIGAVVAFRDISQRKALEQQVLRVQRMNSIGTLAGGIAHDLNNILAPIVMGVERLQELVTDAEALGMVDLIATSAHRGAAMVQQVLSFARGVEGRRVEVQPVAVLADLRKIVGETLPKNIRYVERFQDGLWPVVADPTQLHQVVLNLCINARDAMPHGGELTVGAENVTVSDDEAVLLLEAQPGPYVRLSVEDTGTGIAPGVMEQIFDPFFTTKEVGKGTGLGLATTQAIVRGHGGFLRVYTEVGVGSRFLVYLPAKVHLGQETDPQAPAESVRGNGELVLVVDDEAAIRQITSQTLEAFGYEVLVAADGAEAVALYRERQQEIAVVLTDMMMPVMDGPATIRVLRRLNPKVRIIAASGLSAGPGAAPAPGSGELVFLAKPFTSGELLQAIRRVLDGGARPLA